MGTNYYAKRSLPSDSKQKAIKAIQEGKYDLVRDILDESNEIHIGKRSGGWEFSWDHNNFKYFDPNVGSIIDFLYKYPIVDEYGKEIPNEEFVQMALNWHGINHIQAREQGQLSNYSPNEDLKSLKRNTGEEVFNSLNIDSEGQIRIGPFLFVPFTDFC